MDKRHCQPTTEHTCPPATPRAVEGLGYSIHHSPHPCTLGNCRHTLSFRSVGASLEARSSTHVPSRGKHRWTVPPCLDFFHPRSGNIWAKRIQVPNCSSFCPSMAPCASQLASLFLPHHPLLARNPARVRLHGLARSQTQACFLSSRCYRGRPSGVRLRQPLQKAPLGCPHSVSRG